MNSLQANNKFTIGSKIRLKPSAENWSFSFYTRTWEYPNEPLSLGDDSVGSYVVLYPNDFELVDYIPKPTEKHIHHDMIVEWAANPSRAIVEYFDNIDMCWKYIEKPTWVSSCQYRFKPERTFPTTSLTEKELGDIFLTAGGWNTLDDGLKAIADAAIKKYISDEESK